MIEQLSKQLFIGTRRKLGNVEGATPYTSEVFNKLSTASGTPEEQLLTQCAVASAFEATAFLPPKQDLQTNAIAEEDQRPLCSPGAALVLGEALKNGYLSVVLEWIELALSKNLRPPNNYIPALLELGGPIRVYHETIGLMTGPLGKWLARLNKDWKWLWENDAGPERQEIKIWEEGQLTQRCEFLRHLRTQDAVRAIDLLRKGLTGEKASNRAKLIETLKTNLSGSDEEFLEECLEDKSVEVRSCAAGLLSLLSSSALSKRMIERMEKCVTFKKKFFKKELQIDPPEKSDVSLQRDGILDKAGSGLGARASILMGITACTPMDWWTQTVDGSPDDILGLIKKTDWAEALLLGLVKAAANQGNTKWIISLLTSHWPEKMHPDRETLIRSIPFDDLDHAFNAIITSENIFEIKHLFATKTDGTISKWNEQLSRSVLLALQKAVVRYPSWWELRDMINTTAQHLHSNLLDAALNHWPETHENWEYYGEKTAGFFEIIKLRKKLHKELSS